MKYRTAFFMAWGNFFAVPCPYKLWNDEWRRLQLIFFPVIGLIMGLIWYGLYWTMQRLGLPLPIQAGILTVYPFIISGFIHLDGFMDCNDAILSRRSLEERQRILKDSHVGAFAVISVVILFVMFYSSMWSAFGKGLMGGSVQDVSTLILIPFVSRACSAHAVLANQPIGHSQYVQSYNKNENRKYIILLLFMVLAALLIPILCQMGAYMKTASVNANYWIVLLSIAAVITVSLSASLYGRKQLGGMSGDIAGYALTWAELAGVFIIALF
ncbi:adenosylcobinamide-GDP ribazoletransferase [Clostridium aminobutyricum]|uniref:Adenosylcobinamide-GDP ribazoletransferase n=1 Tax=Clostridium aminobutyricum TaxID=33953 RepID=A0A939DAV9_CLOAM|nr:adenosylcobinamide-GDP ribazoletransferase [Clostridium aminobutyricum]MBN7774366.1 adenosylcobinamide-GDP ribazoletransferase [Clostridium aminobutyricum]